MRVYLSFSPHIPTFSFLVKSMQKISFDIICACKLQIRRN